jgi:hypothetical protein
MQWLWLSCTRMSSFIVDCGACQHCALYSTGKVCRRCFSEENSCDVCRPDLTEESSESSARVGTRNNKNASLHNFNYFVWVRDKVSGTNKTLCIQRNMGEHSVRDSNYVCNIPTKCTCTINTCIIINTILHVSALFAPSSWRKLKISF